MCRPGTQGLLLLACYLVVRMGTAIYSPMCAAALCTGVEMINYLLSCSATVRNEDHLGRVPIHFAAASGIHNSEAVAVVHGDDIMVSDNFDKNVLHWAAEFGKVSVLKAILQRLSPKERKIVVNSKDVDGWTPLAWVCRPSNMDADGYFRTASEQPDYAATIQFLLDHGANKSITFRMGQDDGLVEEFTPLKMAKRCGLDDDILHLLEIKNTNSTETEHPSHEEEDTLLVMDDKMYQRKQASCDFCFSVSACLLIYRYFSRITVSREHRLTTKP